MQFYVIHDEMKHRKFQKYISKLYISNEFAISHIIDAMFYVVTFNQDIIAFKFEKSCFNLI